MKINSNAQSLIEYTAVAALVMAGILIMGPYVIRSINAFFKGGDLQVEESFGEDIRQGPPGGEEIPTCDCDHYHDGGCGDGFACDYGKRVLTQYCQPLGCDEYFGIPIINPYCVWDDECCTPGEPTGRCGFTSQYADPPCEVGEMEMVKLCGEARTPRYYCEPHPDCNDTCTGPPGAHADWCVYPDCCQDLYQETETTWVEHGGCPSDPIDLLCVAECEQGYVPTAGGCIPDCQVASFIRNLSTGDDGRWDIETIQASQVKTAMGLPQDTKLYEENLTITYDAVFSGYDNGGGYTDARAGKYSNDEMWGSYHMVTHTGDGYFHGKTSITTGTANPPNNSYDFSIDEWSAATCTTTNFRSANNPGNDGICNGEQPGDIDHQNYSQWLLNQHGRAYDNHGGSVAVRAKFHPLRYLQQIHMMLCVQDCSGDTDELVEVTVHIKHGDCD